MSARIAALERFFQKPDGVTRWKTWLRSLLEDMFVIDAATLYCQRTRSGQLCALQQLDGATIKRVIDDWGRTPQPYAGADGADDLSAGLSAGAQRPAGGQLFGARHHLPAAQRARPPGLRLFAGAAGADDGQHRAAPPALAARLFHRRLDPRRADRRADRAGRRTRSSSSRIIGTPNSPATSPSAAAPSSCPATPRPRCVQTKEPEHKDDFDEWLARIICFAFSVPPQWAVKVMNRATADNQSAQSEEEGLEPTKEWVKDLIDEIIAEEFASPDLELHWLDEDDADPKGGGGARRPREARRRHAQRNARRLGLDPFDNAAADRPMVLTATGYVPIEANAEGQGTNADAQTGSIVRSRLFTKDYDPDQPRVSAGNPDGGQWTSESVNGTSSNSTIDPGSAPDSSSNPRVQYATLDTDTRTDESE